MTEVTVALKIDCATYAGMRHGIPRILDILGEMGIKGTFYFALGPDNTGKTIRRIFLHQGTVANIFRSPWRHDPVTFLYGLMLPAPHIGSKFGPLMLRTRNEGHEIGIHCWDHAKWHDLLPYLPKPITAMELGRAAALFQEITGTRAKTTAAPGWMVTADSLEIQDAMLLSHCSDTRGHSPFYPVVEGRKFSTLQIPTTWPTLDELYCRGLKTPQQMLAAYLSLLKPGLQVYTVQAELEGRRFVPLFMELLRQMAGQGVRFATLAEAAREYSGRAGEATLALKNLPGRAGRVAVQENQQI